MFFYKYQQRKYSIVAFHAQMKKLLEENATSVKYFVEYNVNDSDTNKQLATRLIDNQYEIGNLIGMFYGEKEKLSGEFVEFMQLIGEAVETIRWRKHIGNFRKRWSLFADRLINTLNTYNEWHIRDFFYKQMLLIESMIKSFINKSVPQQVYYYNELVKNNTKLSDIISNAIVQQNSTLFA